MTIEQDCDSSLRNAKRNKCSNFGVYQSSLHLEIKNQFQQHTVHRYVFVFYAFKTNDNNEHNTIQANNVCHDSQHCRRRVWYWVWWRPCIGTYLNFGIVYTGKLLCVVILFLCCTCLCLFSCPVFTRLLFDLLQFANIACFKRVVSSSSVGHCNSSATGTSHTWSTTTSHTYSRML